MLARSVVHTMAWGSVSQGQHSSIFLISGSLPESMDVSGMPVSTRDYEISPRKRFRSKWSGCCPESGLSALSIVRRRFAVCPWRVGHPQCNFFRDILQVNEEDFEVAEEEYWDSEDEYDSDDPQSEASDSEGFGE